MSPRPFDVIVVGGGIAGVSIGFELAGQQRVCLLEMETTLGYHSSGRSAAAFIETYGNLPIRALTAASREFFLDPPDFAPSPLVAPLPLLYLARAGRSEAVRALHADVSALTPSAHLVDAAEAERMCPVLRPGYTELGLVDPSALDIDVHALHQGFTHGLRSRHATIVRAARVVAARHDRQAWTLTDSSGDSFIAPLVVNAAGAWCDEIGELLGARRVGIAPLRRSVFMLPGRSVAVPLTIDVDDSFYFKPDGGDQYLCSPADETYQPPGDARPDEVEIARALDAINAATTIDARHVRTSWAGLRSFVADRTPVVGYDPEVTGLFWYAGQGGYGMQTSPALARTGAALAAGHDAPHDVAARGLVTALLSPARPALTRVSAS